MDTIDRILAEDNLSADEKVVVLRELGMRLMRQGRNHHKIWAGEHAAKDLRLGRCLCGAEVWADGSPEFNLCPACLYAQAIRVKREIDNLTGVRP